MCVCVCVCVESNDRFPELTHALDIRTYRSLIVVGLLDGIQFSPKEEIKSVGRSTLECISEGVHGKISLMSLSFISQHALFVLLGWYLR